MRHNLRTAEYFSAPARYTHKRVYIRLYPVSIEKLAESVEPELFEKSFVILGHFAALDSENRRAGAFPVADRLRETDEENHSLRIVRHGGIEYIKTFSIEPRLRMKFAQTGDRKIKAQVQPILMFAD